MIRYENMYTLDELNTKHDSILRQIDFLENDLQSTLAARWYTIRRESRYNEPDEIEDIKKDLDALQRIEDTIEDILHNMRKIEHRIIMAKLRHPDFKM
jgi:hypothetical protein